MSDAPERAQARSTTSLKRDGTIGKITKKPAWAARRKIWW